MSPSRPVVAACCVLAWSLPAQSPLRVPLAAELPALADLSSWQLHVGSGDAKAEQRSAFLVGNGRVLGCFGLADRAATVQALIGPDYDADDTPADGLFGEQRFVLRVAGEERQLPRQTVARVRGAGFVVTEDRGDDGVSLVTLDFATANETQLCRVVVVHNDSKVALERAELVAEVPLAHDDTDGDVLFVDNTSVRHAARARFEFVGGAVRSGRSLVHSLGTIAAGQSAQAEFVIRTYRRGDTELWPDPMPPAIERAAASTLAWWQERLAGTTRVLGDDACFVDLIEDGKVQLLTWRCARNGIIGPVLSSRFVPLRELAGPLLACLRYGLFDDARSMLVELRRVALRDMALPTRLAFADEPVEPAPGLDPAKIVMPGDGSASLAVLLHYWYWRASGDDRLVREHLPFLLACLDGQKFSPEGLQSYAADEPFLAEAWRATLGDEFAAAGLVAAADASRRHTLSLQASVQFLLANASMGELTEVVDRQDHPDRYKPGDQDTPLRRHYVQRMFDVAQVTERWFWQAPDDRFAVALSPSDAKAQPGVIADVALGLPWLGWTFATQDRSRHHVASVLKALWRAPDAIRVGLSGGTGVSTGVTQSLLVHALAEGNDPAWLGALSELMRLAGPAGNWAARYDARGLLLGIDGAPAVASAHATGVAIDAIFFALTGMRGVAIPGWDNGRQARFRPRLPAGVRQLELRDVRRDGRHLHMQCAIVDRPEKPGAPALHCRIEMQNPPPDAEHIVCAVNVGATTLVRYLAQRLPIIDDTVDVPVDPGALYPGPPGAGR
ncbi:MAG TPA: hypothetical protein VFZ65_14290 [Planctomycetota bacterium]|nr:hypothetical protein [Planctomycetota bacterium]